MFRRINSWCREIWERNQRFKTAFLGSWGIFLVTLGLARRRRYFIKAL